MDFEWDEHKNRSNFEKHGITFEEATAIFDGPTFTTVDDRSEYNEVREISIGTLGMAVIAVVVHTDRNGNIRLISARKANKRERTIYHGYIERTIEEH